ncbi:MAG: MobQ family relaxase [Eubacteriales bacterium]|nr:MobQ family relaxase [Eubacteriales bacterium]
MAIYHLEAKVVSRGTGRSAVAASAYLSCTNILNDYDGVRHDFTRKKGLVWREVFLPEYAPPEWKDRGVLWNAVEENEKTKDSRLAREFVPALPIELTPAQWQELLSDFIQNSFVAEGMCADVAIHDPNPPGHNPHAHIMLTVRPLDEQGNWQYKTEKEYLCVKDGEERGFTAAEFKIAQKDGWEKQYPYKVGRKKVYMPPSEAEKQGLERASKHPKSTKFGRQNPISERWNSEEQLVVWRKAWADVTNRYLERYGHDARIDHRSHADRGLTEQPTIHEGVVARALEAKGIISDRCELNRQIKADNALLRELKASVKKLIDTVKNTIPTLAEAMESLRGKMIFFCYQLGYIRKGKNSMSKYVDTAGPILERYDELKQEIKEKSREQKSLHSEKKDTSVFNVKKQMELSQRITELTEDLEELRSERTMLLNQLDCADDKEVRKVKTSVSNMKDSLKDLDAKEEQFAAELDAAQKEFVALQEQAADFDPIELYDARQAIRPEMEQDAVHKLQKQYADKYSHLTMVDGKREVSLMLDEYAEGQEIQQMKREQQRRLQRENKQSQPKKRRDAWER